MGLTVTKAMATPELQHLVYSLDLQWLQDMPGSAVVVVNIYRQTSSMDSIPRVGGVTDDIWIWYSCLHRKTYFDEVRIYLENGRNP